MNFTVLDETKVKQWDGMLEIILQTIEKQATEIKHLRDDRLMSLKEVCDYTGFGEAWVLRHKDKIGYSQIGCKDLRFRKEHIDNYFNSSKHFIKAKQS